SSHSPYTKIPEGFRPQKYCSNCLAIKKKSVIDRFRLLHDEIKLFFCLPWAAPLHPCSNRYSFFPASSSRGSSSSTPSFLERAPNTLSMDVRFLTEPLFHDEAFLDLHHELQIASNEATLLPRFLLHWSSSLLFDYTLLRSLTHKAAISLFKILKLDCGENQLAVANAQLPLLPLAKHQLQRALDRAYAVVLALLHSLYRNATPRALGMGTKCTWYGYGLDMRSEMPWKRLGRSGSIILRKVPNRSHQKQGQNKHVSRASSLQHLNIGGTFISDESLFAIANHCPRLKKLVVTWVIKCSALQYLLVNGTNNVSDCDASNNHIRI
ncbi:hypothetical protein KI387_023739, partial [Taxus chinensis]